MGGHGFGLRHPEPTEIIDEIVKEYGEFGDPRELKSAVQDEIRTLGLFDALLGNHERHSPKGGSKTGSQ